MPLKGITGCRTTSHEMVLIDKLVSSEDFHGQPGDGSPRDIISADPGVVYRYLCPTNWCSAPRPGPGVGFAVGRTGQWAIFNETESNWGEMWLRTQARSIVSNREDILAIDWLNHHVVVGGARSGKVLLDDTRVPGGEATLRL